jgi:hypothetical protein
VSAMASIARPGSTQSPGRQVVPGAPNRPVRRPPFIPANGMTPAGVLALQRGAGNAAVAQRMAQRQPVTVSRCGPDHPGCGCDREQAAEEPTVQRKDPFSGFPAPPGSPLGPPASDVLRFSTRMFMDQSLPTECPRCHRDRPTAPLSPVLVDRDATEPRLVAWAAESETALHQGGTVRRLQLDPAAFDPLVDDYGAGLTKRITSSREFEGTDQRRADGAETIRRRWSDIRPSVRDKLVTWYQGELATAVGMTPKGASLIVAPAALQSVLTTRHGGRAFLGRLNAEAAPGERHGIFVIHDIDGSMIWFALPDRPLWLYGISQHEFIRHDPFIAEMSRQVYDNTRWILQVMPFLLKVGAFGLGFSGSVALILLGIVLDELATEMQADADGRPGRSVEEILGSAGTQFLVDRLFHHLLGGAGKVAAPAGKAAAKAERIAERAAPLIKRELAAAEKPLVKGALESGSARTVTDAALKAEGYSVEVVVQSAGERHVYRLNKSGRWCRFSSPLCDLDLGADVVAATKSPASFTRGQLEDLRNKIATINSEIEFLTDIWQRMRRVGRMDLSLLSPKERALLDELVPSGDATRLTLDELRRLPRSQGLAGEVAKGADVEKELVARLLREGRPLYETMRAVSPSSAARSRVLREAGGRDAATGLKPRLGTLDVDHVVPLSEIVRMPGFDKLRPERQLELVNDVTNLRAIDSAANSSRLDRSFSEWPQAAVHYDPAALARMRKLEDELRTYVTGRIAVLSRP